MKTDTAPVTGKTTDRPTSAGEWLWKPEGQNAPEQALIAYFCSSETFIPVLVTETPSAGRIYQELRMGGHALCGFKPWSGIWRKAA